MSNNNIKAEIEGSGNIVIQGITGSTITINPNNLDEVKNFLMNFQDEISALPVNILNMLKSNDHPFDEDIKGVIVKLTIGFAYPELHPEKRSVSFQVYITNLEKVHRYCHQPYFKFNKPISFAEGTNPHDTFVLFQTEYSKVKFPVRLEFGEQVMADFQIISNQFALYDQLDDGESYMQAFVSTTLGELYSSNEYNVSKFIKEYKEFMGPWE